jgi:hypothetical protein
MRLKLSESSIASRFKVHPKIRADATFDFCNSIPSERTSSKPVGRSQVTSECGGFGDGEAQGAMAAIERANGPGGDRVTMQRVVVLALNPKIPRPLVGKLTWQQWLRPQFFREGRTDAEKFVDQGYFKECSTSSSNPMMVERPRRQLLRHVGEVAVDGLRRYDVLANDEGDRDVDGRALRPIVGGKPHGLALDIAGRNASRGAGPDLLVAVAIGW